MFPIHVGEDYPTASVREHSDPVRPRTPKQADRVISPSPLLLSVVKEMLIAQCIDVV